MVIAWVGVSGGKGEQNVRRVTIFSFVTIFPFFDAVLYFDHPI